MTTHAKHTDYLSQTIATSIATIMLASWFTASVHAQDEEDKRAVMFERTGFVSLAGKDIPEFHKRIEITDAQNRSIKGEWIAIDRQNSKVKFRRTDGKEFDIGMESLTPKDHRYAELETGILWQIDPTPTPVDIVTDEILGFEAMNETHVQFRVVNVNDPSVPTVRGYRIDLLTEQDRALIKKKTGRELVVPDKPVVRHNPSLIFGRPVPRYERTYFVATMGFMGITFTPKEMVDSVITRTMTSAFIHEYYNSSYEEAEDREKKNGKSLAAVLKIIGEEPSPLTEQRSIKPLFAKHKLTIYEEKVPRDPAQPERFIKGDRTVFSQPGVPIDGELQAFHFICQFLHLSAGKPKVPLAKLLENTNQGFTGVARSKNGAKLASPPEQRRKIYHSSDVMEGIEKTHGFKPWRIFVLDRDKHHHRKEGVLRLFFQQLTGELIRHHIRNGKPVYARKATGQDGSRTHGIQLVITGFKSEPGKPLILEAISIKGSILGNDPHTGEYEVTETTIPETELDTMTVTFLESA